MSVRYQFEEELQQLKKEIMFLAEKVEQSYVQVIEAVKENDVAVMEEIIDNDEKINDLELSINEKATYLIATQQPVASDLRKIIVSLKVSSDLERIGDLTVDIAKTGLRLQNNNELLLAFEEPLLKIAMKVKGMIKAVMEAFKDSNILSAQKIASKDDEIDAEYGIFIKSIFNAHVGKNEDVEQITQMAFMSRYVERIADYCTNISEWIIYEVTGQRLDLN